MNIDEKLNFGVYKGLTIKEVFQGTNFANKEILKAFIKARLKWANLLTNDCGVLLEFMTFEISDTIMRVTPLTSDLNGDWSKTIEGLFKISESDPANPTPTPMTLKVISEKDLDIHQKFIQVLKKGNPKYISWCLNNVNHFFIDPSDLDELTSLDIQNFLGIKVQHKIEDIYVFTELVSETKFAFSDATLNNNWKKYNKANQRIESVQCDELDYDNYQDDTDDNYCGACESDPCMCSDPDPG